jgi:predicted metal-binding protein
MKEISESDLAVSLGKKFGISEAMVIYTTKIDVKDYVLAKCKFGCTRYGTNWCCPPNTHTPEQTRQLLKDYSKAILLIGESKGIENHNEFRKGLLEIEKAMMQRGYYKALALPIGGCTTCERCAYLDGKNCIHPEDKRPSVEGMGIDILSTVKRFKKNVDNVDKDKDKRYGLILLD